MLSIQPQTNLYCETKFSSSLCYSPTSSLASPVTEL